jgi:hypothetical protein
MDISELIASLDSRRLATITALDNQYLRLAIAALIRSAQLNEPRSDYFAYASNLHIE